MYNSNYILDIDGTILDGKRVINSAAKFIKDLQEFGTQFLLATNSIKSPYVQLERMLKVGIEVSEDIIYNPIKSINAYLKSSEIDNAFIVGSDEEISQVNAKYNDKKPAIIILLDFEKMNYGYSVLQKIIDLINDDCQIITASRSPYYLVSEHQKIDTGAFVALIESITDKEIELFGKPSLNYFAGAKSYFSDSSKEIVLVGDDFSTDIAGAKKANINSVLMRSGKYKNGDEGRVIPDLVINDFDDLRTHSE